MGGPPWYIRDVIRLWVMLMYWGLEWLARLSQPPGRHPVLVLDEVRGFFSDLDPFTRVTNWRKKELMLSESCSFFRHPEGPKRPTTKDMGVVLNSFEGSVASAVNKARRMLFYLKIILFCPYPQHSSLFVQSFYSETSSIPFQSISRCTGGFSVSSAKQLSIGFAYCSLSIDESVLISSQNSPKGLLKFHRKLTVDQYWPIGPPWAA